MNPVTSAAAGWQAAAGPAAPVRATRVAHLDVARGLSIVLVALYHSGLQPLMPLTMQAIGLFRLPLFFFLAGVVFPTGRGPVRVARERAQSLLQPYLLVLLLLLGRSLLKGEADPLAILAGIGWANGGTIEWIPMWFLPHLWLVSVVAGAWLAFSGWLRWPALAQAGSWGCLFFAGAALLQPQRTVTLELGQHALAWPWWPLSADLLGISLAFLLLGVRWQQQARAFMPRAAGVAGAAVLFLALAIGSPALLNLNLRQCVAPAAVAVAALAGIYLMLSLAWWLGRFGWARVGWGHLGRASLFILIFHDHIDNKVQAWLLPRWGEASALPVALVAFGCCLAVPLLIHAVVMRQPALARAFGVRPVPRRAQ